MSHLPEVPPDRLDPEVRELLDEVQEMLGFHPRFFRVVAWSPSLLRSVWRLERDVLLRGRLPQTLKERVMIAVAQDKRCGYCEAVHTVIALELGVPLAELEATRTPEALEALAPREAAVIEFATRLSRDARSVRDEDFAALRAHGYEDADIGEIVALSILCSWLATLAIGLGLEIDPVIAQRLPGGTP